MLTNFKKSLLAVVLGNLIYFGLLYDHLPEYLRHQPHALDWGLLLDFFICMSVFRIIGRAANRRHAAPKTEHL